MLQHIKKIILAVLLVLTGGVLLSSAALAAWEQPRLGYRMSAISKPIPAPGFVLEDMDEIKVNFEKFRGKVVLLNFWATWCPPCRREMPSMERLYQKYKEKAFTIVAINQMEDIDTVFSFTGQLTLSPTFVILFDKTSDTSKNYRVNGLPTTFLIDKKGRIRYRAIGGREFDHVEIEKIIEALINE